MEREPIEIKFQFSYNAKPMTALAADVGETGAAFKAAGGDAGRFGALVHKTQQRLKSFAASEQVTLLGEDAPLVLEEAAARVDLLAVRLGEAEVKALAARDALAAAEPGSRAWDQAAARLAAADAESKRLALSLSEIPKKLDAAADATRRAADEAASYEGRLRQVSQGADVYGDVSSRLMPVAGLAGQVSPELGEAGMLVADLADAKEQLSKLGPALVELGTRAQALPGILGAVSTSAAAAAAGMGPVAAGFAAVAAPLALVAAAVAAVVAVFKILEGHANRAAEAAREARDARFAEYESEQDRRDLLLTGRADEVAAQRQHLQVMQSLQVQQRDTEVELASQAAGEVTQFHNSARTVISGFFDNLFSGREVWDQEGYARNLYGVDREHLEAIDAQNEALGEQAQQMDLLSEETERLLAARETELAAARESIDALERSKSARQRVADIEANYSTARLQEELDANRQLQAATREVAATTGQRLEAIDAERAALEAQGDLSDAEVVRLGTLNALYDEYNQALAQNQDELDDLVAQEQDLERAAPGVANREAEAAAIDAVDAALQREIQSRELARTATTQQIQERLQALRDEEAAVRAAMQQVAALAQTSEAAAEQLASYEQRLGDLRDEQAMLAEAAPAVSQREADALWQEGVAAYQDFQEEVRDLHVKFGQDMADLEARALAKREDILAKSHQTRTKLDARLAQDLKEVEADLGKQRTKILDDYARQEKTIRARQAHEDAQELKAHLRNLGRLARERNVAAFIEATEDYQFGQAQKGDDRGFEAAQRREEHAQELADLKAQGEEKRAALREGHAQEVAETRAAQAQQLAELQASLQAEQAAKAQALQEQLAQRRQAFAEEMAALNARLTGEDQMATAAYQDMSADFAGFLGTMASGVDQLAALGQQRMQQAAQAASAAPTAAVDDRGQSGALQKVVGAGFNLLGRLTQNAVQQVRERGSEEQRARLAAWEQQYGFLQGAAQEETQLKEEAHGEQTRLLAQHQDAQARRTGQHYAAMGREAEGFMGSLGGVFDRLGAMATHLRSTVAQAAEVNLSQAGRARPAPRETKVEVHMPVHNPAFGEISTPAQVSRQLQDFAQVQANRWGDLLARTRARFA